jgi:glutamate synthase (NADPH/NADH) small chain
VFEKDDKLGGLLRYGIPDFKLEKWVVDRRLDLLREEGIEFATGSHVGEDPTLKHIRKEFDAILLAVGALQAHDLPVPGRELDGVHLAMDYLVQQNRRVAGEQIEGDGAIEAYNRRVVIIGGGDTSADCLGNAHREGAISSQVLTHGPLPPDAPAPLSWPDWPFILRTYPAHEEGGERCWSVAITGFSGENGRVERVHLIEVERIPGGQLRRLPGNESTVEADLVLLAIGFAGPVPDRLLTELAVEFRDDGSILGGADTEAPRYSTTVPGVYTAGDARRGASLIVWAIAEGRQAAREMDRALMT